MIDAFFPYRFDRRFLLQWVPFGPRPDRDGVTLSAETFRATFGRLVLETPRANVAGAHVTADYRWFKAIGARLSAVDDGLTFGTNAARGVCVHFVTPVPHVLGLRAHSALTVTVADCDGLVAAIGAVPDS
jgi:hypothetical protein